MSAVGYLNPHFCRAAHARCGERPVVRHKMDPQQRHVFHVHSLFDSAHVEWFPPEFSDQLANDALRAHVLAAEQHGRLHVCVREAVVLEVLVTVDRERLDDTRARRDGLQARGAGLLAPEAVRQARTHRVRAVDEDRAGQPPRERGNHRVVRREWRGREHHLGCPHRLFGRGDLQCRVALEKCSRAAGFRVARGHEDPMARPLQVIRERRTHLPVTDERNRHVTPHQSAGRS